MDNQTTECPDIDAFIAACRARAITTAIVAWRHEWGPRELAEGGVEYGPQATCWLLGYTGGHLIRCIAETTRREQAVARLEAAGFQVETRERISSAIRT